ncbi:MAG: glycosyltransferase [Ignavibacteriaceae bacterium]|jgi:glycosyltransferase involved in cell wall biosynthesis|nr:glycosyltransferase [Ignavibacteriaceae bacterium]
MKSKTISIKKKTINICHIVNIIDGKADGVFCHLNKLLTIIDKEQFNQIVIFHGGETIKSCLLKNNIQFYEIKSLSSSFPLNAFFQIAQIIKKESVDIIHTHLVKPYILAGILNIFLKKKFIFNYHGSFIKNDYNTLLQQKVYTILHRIIIKINPPNIVLTPSRNSISLLMDKDIMFSKILAYNSTYLYSSQPMDQEIINKIINFKFNSFLLAYVGRLSHEKNVFDVINILKILSNKHEMNVKLIIIGIGPEERVLKNYVSELNLTKSVLFLGFIEFASAYFYLFDVLILTSKREGMPNVVWESMGNQIPIVAADVGGIKDIVHENRCGFVFPPNNLQLAANFLKYLYDNPKLKLQLGENGLTAINQKYSIPHFKYYFQNLYVSLTKIG